MGQLVLSGACAQGKPEEVIEILVLDRGQDPGLDGALAAASAANAEGWLAYVGGRSLFFAPWSRGTVVGLLNSLSQVLPVYAMATPLSSSQGGADAAEAGQLVSAWDPSSFDQIMLDAEPSFFNANPNGFVAYAGAWVNAVQAAGIRACLYSTPGPITACWGAGVNPDVVLVANYPFRAGVLWGPPDPSSIPGLSDGIFKGRRGWQYANEVTFAGLNCDISVTQFRLRGGLGGPDDMFTDADRATLQALLASAADKQAPFLVAAGKTVFISGPDQNSQWNVCPQDKPAAVKVWCYDVQGHVLSGVTPTLFPNRPGVAGPVPGYGTAAQLGASGPCTLGFQNDGPGDVWVTLH